MKTFAVIVGALATIATAAPAVGTAIQEEKRDTMSQQLNEFGFDPLGLSYLASTNPFDLSKLQSLGRNNGLDLLGFAPLFNAQSLDLNSLLQLQQLSTLLAIAGTGILDPLNLSKLPLGGLNLGLLSNPLGGLNLGSLLDPSVIKQILPAAQPLTNPLSPALRDPFAGLLTPTDPISSLLNGLKGGDPVGGLLKGVDDAVSSLLGGGAAGGPIQDLLKGLGGGEDLGDILKSLLTGNGSTGPLAGPLSILAIALEPLLGPLRQVLKPVTDALDPVTDTVKPVIDSVGAGPIAAAVGIE